MPPSTIGGINRLPEEEKRAIYSRVIPHELLDRFNMPALDSIRLQSMLKFDFEPGSTDVEMSLFHELRFPDPILYGHLTDTMNGQIHVLRPGRVDAGGTIATGKIAVIGRRDKDRGVRKLLPDPFDITGVTDKTPF